MSILVASIAEAAGVAILGPLFAAMWLFGAAYALFCVGTWRCPRCANHYFVRGMTQNVFGRSCQHCGLRKWSLDGQLSRD